MDSNVNSGKREEIQDGAPAEQSNGNGAALGPLDVAAKTLTGDMRDRVLDIMRGLPVAWPAMERYQQKQLVARVEFIVGTVVESAVGLIAARDFPTIHVGLEQVTFKPKGIEAKLSMSALDRARRHELVDAQGKVIILVVADSNAFRGERAAAKIDAADTKPEALGDPELPLGEGRAVKGIVEVAGEAVEGAADGIDLDAEVAAAEAAPEPPKGCARGRRALDPEIAAP